VCDHEDEKRILTFRGLDRKDLLLKDNYNDYFLDSRKKRAHFIK
jgi:hypothetical protein